MNNRLPTASEFQSRWMRGDVAPPVTVADKEPDLPRIWYPHEIETQHVSVTNHNHCRFHVPADVLVSTEWYSAEGMDLLTIYCITHQGATNNTTFSLYVSADLDTQGAEVFSHVCGNTASMSLEHVYNTGSPYDAVAGLGTFHAENKRARPLFWRAEMVTVAGVPFSLMVLGTKT